LCIIDLGLPDMDGIEVMQRVRAQSACGILILTGRAHISDRVMGLELGADDYMLKPFEPRELVARVSSILRRRENTQSNRPAPKVPNSPAGTSIGNNTLQARQWRGTPVSAPRKPNCCASSSATRTAFCNANN
jgi:two-component system OmpR family response regulator